MKKCRLIFLMAIIFIAISSCEDDFFSPPTLGGVWNVTEYDAEGAVLTFKVGIDYFPGDMNRILIDNFSNLGTGYEVTASVLGGNLTISRQSITGKGGSYTVSGSGTVTSNLRKINWEYRIDGEDFTAVFTK